jgi:protein involved in polysaccharide export with SLBB domain
MFKARFPAMVLMLPAFAVVVVRGQNGPAIRPRRAQTGAATSANLAPPHRAVAEAKKLYKAGVKDGLAGRFAEAANKFEQAVKLDPGYADAWLSLGHAYFDLHQWEPAIDNLQRGLALKPKDKFAADLLAEARSRLDKENQAPKPGAETIARTTENVSLASLGKPALGTAKSTDESGLTKVYRVGAGDVLDVRLTDAVSTEPALFTITPAGLLEHPDLSAPLRCAGLTVEEITARIESDLKRRAFTGHAAVSVAVNEYGSHMILVSGLVKEPGTKIIKREAIPLYVVVADAQPLPEAGSVTVLKHDTRESYLIDLLKTSDLSLLVRPGDVITVQANPAQFFYVDGEVKSAGEKSFRPGLTLTQAIIAAGGLTKNAKEVRLARDNGRGFLVISHYKLKEVNSGKIADPLLQPGDRITIGK